MSLIPWLTMAALSAGAGYYNPIAQPGEPGYTATPRHHFRGTMENDSAFGNDSSYSHGTRLDYAQCLNNGDAWGVSLMAAEGFFFPVAEDETVTLGIPGPGFVYAPVVEGADAGTVRVCIDGHRVGRVAMRYGKTVELSTEEEQSLWDRLFGGD